MTQTQNKSAYRSGFVTIIGSPNVGKSTLMNRMVGQKISIVSDRAQTTRNRITGIVSRKDYQIIFLDTPGVTAPKNRLGEYMLKVAFDAVNEVEAILLMLDASVGIREKDELLLSRLGERCGKTAVVAAINKSDLVSLGDIDEIRERLEKETYIKNEAYLDPEEKFWDYRTKEVQPGKYIDTSRSEIGWVDNLIHNIKYFEQNKGVTARIVDMTPEEYFEECATLFHNSVESQKKQIAADTETIEHLTDVIKKFGKRFPIPYINIANNSQEGRHRMYVLGELFGWDKAVPVLIIQDVNNVRVPGKELK